ncbi:MAG: hypothetical protein JAY90_10835 [Candidatus Thiodiazotropha lotti]|nr:hypothetical protein [Candidatus Thiodiazotropha lotti]
MTAKPPGMLFNNSNGSIIRQTDHKGSRMRLTLLTCLLSLLVAIPAQAATDYNYFSEVLQLEKRWARLSARTIQRYLVYLEKKGLYKNLAAKTQDRFRGEVETLLMSRLTWDKVGERVAIKVISGCSDETLRNFAEAYQKRGTEAGVAAAFEYLACATEGVSRAMVIIQAEFKKAAPSLNRLAEQYRDQ